MPRCVTHGLTLQSVVMCFGPGWQQQALGVMGTQRRGLALSAW